MAIPTKYKGRQYRSLLEAKWAAFFDQLRWPVEYEPFELDGWIPDFIIAGKHPVLVEVKPRLADVNPAKVRAPGYETLCVSGVPFDDPAHPAGRYAATRMGALLPVAGAGRVALYAWDDQRRRFDFRARGGIAMRVSGSDIAVEATNPRCFRIVFVYLDQNGVEQRAPYSDALCARFDSGEYTWLYTTDEHRPADVDLEPDIFSWTQVHDREVRAIWAEACNEVQWKRPA